MSETAGLVAIIIVGGLLFAGAYVGRPRIRRWRQGPRKP